MRALPSHGLDTQLGTTATQCRAQEGRAAGRIRRLGSQLLPVPVQGPRDEPLPEPGEILVTDEAMMKIREKYVQERDRRLEARPEGTAQYARFEDLAKVDERFKRMLEWRFPGPGKGLLKPVNDEVEVCIIGAGFGGLCAGARLVREGISPKDIRLVEKGLDVGGTWYWNRYPGAMCDIEAYLYMPLLEEMGYVPTEKYAHGPEIYDYTRRLAESHGLYDNACLGAQVFRIQWDESSNMWMVSTKRGDEFKARYIIMNFGIYNTPKLPGVPGIEDFKGHIFHNQCWDYEYTGGTPQGDLHKLRDKSVAIVGTGASAIQVVPELAKNAKQVYVFQRTPAVVGIRNNGQTTEEFARENLSHPGWQKERQKNFFAMTQTTGGAEKDLVNDGWTFMIRSTIMKPALLWQERMHKLKKDPSLRAQLALEVKEISNISELQAMEWVRRRIQKIVHDPKTAEGLMPWYDLWCKRPTFNDDYYAAFNEPNVKLVDTGGLGLDRYSPKGVVVKGTEYEVDCIVFSTGYEANQNSEETALRNLGYDIIGKGGQSLSEKWGSAPHRYGAGPKTYRSYHSRGFPNLFMQNGPQGVFTSNNCYQLDECSKHFAHIIKRMKDEGRSVFDVKQEMEDKHVDLIWKMSPVADGKQHICTPGIHNHEGRRQKAGTKSLHFFIPGGAGELFKELEKERESGTALNCFDLA